MDAFIGEIRLFPYTYEPVNWMLCDGRQMSIPQYQALAAVIGIQFGGDGKTYFNLPNLQGRVAVGAGDDPTDTFDPVFASHSGARSVTLTTSNMPSHTHTLTGAQAGMATRSTTAAGNLLTGITFKPTTGTTPLSSFPYIPDPAAAPVTLGAQTLSPFVGGTNGSTVAHENRQPALGLWWCICVMDGAFPVRPD